MKETAPNIPTAHIHKALSFIRKIQEQDGSFLGYTSTNEYDFTSRTPSPNTFSTSLILQALATSPEKSARPIIQKALHFLLKEQNPDGSWNYWKKDSGEHATKPYPNDIDDTFVALSAIHATDPSSITGEMIGKAAKLLFRTETKEGGPYRTWILDPEKYPNWKDVDLGANANVAHFLSLQEITLESITALIEKAILTDKYPSLYYYNPAVIVYFISKSYKGKFIAKLEKKILALLVEADDALTVALLLSSYSHAKRNSNIATPLKTATILEQARTKLLNLQNKNGSWNPAGFFVEENKKGAGGIIYMGSEALTTALAIEALQLDIQHKTSEKILAQTIAQTTTEKIVKALTQITQQTKKECSALQQSIRKQLSQTLSNLRKKGTLEHIAMLSYHFHQACNKKEPDQKIKQADLKKITELGVANIFGWIAYTSYDHFLDHEGRPEELSLANICHRKSFALFSRHMSNFPSAQKPNAQSTPSVGKVFDSIDVANAWEITRCRFSTDALIATIKLPSTIPDHYLANKSAGHTLGPLALTSPALRHQTQKLIATYCIVRQMDDDAHDWLDDLKKGMITSATLPLLRHLQRISKKSPPAKQSISAIIKNQNALAQLQNDYWTHIAPELARTILKKSRAYRKILAAHPLIKNPAYFEELIALHERSASKVLDETEKIASFASAFETN